MGEDEKMFQIGVRALIAVALLTVGLQVCYRTQKNALNDIRRETRTTMQNVTVAQTKFESLTRPEFLRSVVVEMNPRAEIVGTKKYISIDDIPMR